MTKEELLIIISQGENETVEFKQSFNKAVIESVVAFSNHKGGKILIGVNNNDGISGVSINEETVQKWVNEIKQNTNPQVIPNVEIVNIDGNSVVIFSIIE